MDVVDWVIVGGGLHGVCAARALVEQGASVQIVEPSGRLLSRWSARAEALAMVWMRSPVGHHLDAQPANLHHFLHRPEHADVARLGGDFRRPKYEAFKRHARDVIERYRLDEIVVPGRVDSLRILGDRLEVGGSEASGAGGPVGLSARRVLIATGSNRTRMPSWARRLQREGAPIHHVFDPGAQLEHDIVGGGISAIQRALRVYRSTGRAVRLWMRRPVRVEEFDFDRDWMKHRFIARWSGWSDLQRLAFLERNRAHGGVPARLASRFEQAVRSGQIEVWHEEPEATWDASSGRLHLAGASRTVESSGLTLATGFEPETLPEWLCAFAHQHRLPTFEGLPRLDDEMHWGAGVHFSGPLARLRLGPMANSIVGARWAASLLPGVRMQPT